MHPLNTIVRKFVGKGHEHMSIWSKLHALNAFRKLYIEHEQEMKFFLNAVRIIDIYRYFLIALEFTIEMQTSRNRGL